MPSKDLHILFFVPSSKSYTKDVNVKKIKKAAPLVKIAYNEILKGNFWPALTLNGLIYSSTLGYDASISLEALNSGALASGLCGKGPAVTTVVTKDKIDSVRNTLEDFKGKIIETEINYEKAMVIS
jgi:shikimate kinase